MQPGLAEAIGIDCCACYYQTYDKMTDKSVLLLEDLKARPGPLEE